jgi:putative transposase
LAATGRLSADVAPGQQPARPTAALGRDPGTRVPARTREPCWGHRRIYGELVTLGLRASPTSVRRLLARAQLHPAPRRAGPSWREFPQAQAQSIVGCLAGPTTNPDGGRVAQQARTPGLLFAEQQIRFLLQDRDNTYTGPFDEVFPSEQITIPRTPVRTPKANTIAERFVRTARAERLDWLPILNRRHLARVLRVYTEHHNPRAPAPRHRPAPTGSAQRAHSNDHRRDPTVATSPAASTTSTTEPPPERPPE